MNLLVHKFKLKILIGVHLVLKSLDEFTTEGVQETSCWDTGIKRLLVVQARLYRSTLLPVARTSLKLKNKYLPTWCRLLDVHLLIHFYVRTRPFHWLRQTADKWLAIRPKKKKKIRQQKKRKETSWENKIRIKFPPWLN